MESRLVPAVCARLLAALCAMLVPATATAQRTVGQLRIEVRDIAGSPVDASGTLDSDATQVRRAFDIDSTGVYVAIDLPFGVYRVEIMRAGFERSVSAVDVRSALPVAHVVTLTLAGFRTAVNVTAAPATILDPFRGAAANSIGADLLRDRPSAAPGRSLIDLINTQPGVLLEANGVLHARGSEYQVQYVIDGIPLRDNRSPAFAQSLGIDEFESMTVRTGGYPAEFGAKLGAVIEVSTAHDPRTGLHGTASLEAGSFSTLNAYASGQYSTGRTAAGFGVEHMTTGRYLDPPNEANFTNHGEASGVSVRFERAWIDGTRTRGYGYHRSSTFQVPNEALQQEAGQLQERTAEETLGQAAHQQVLSPTVLLNARMMARASDTTLIGNESSIPIKPFQDRTVRELHANGSISVHRGRHELKAGGEMTFGALDERFESTITARELDGFEVFDDAVPDRFTFEDEGALREHALFVQDLTRLGPLTLQAGIRYDYYRLRTEDHGLSPRLSGSWFVAPLGLVVHASYDRTFETPPIENILLAGANVVEDLGGEGESLTIEPSRGHFLESGFSKQLFDRVRLDGTFFSRRATNVVDDDLLLNTGVSFPLTFSRAVVTGIETKLEIAAWGPVSGWVSYSNATGRGELPFAGGLFLGDEAGELLEGRGRFRLSQDQRHTARARGRVSLSPRAWVAVGGSYNSGLPIEPEGVFDTDVLVRQYGAAVVEQADFEKGRVRPSWSLDASAGATLVRSGDRTLRLQADVFNLTDRLNVINFAGLLSGTAVAPRRTMAVRLHAGF
jgi:TonB-dependent receptor-like protein